MKYQLYRPGVTRRPECYMIAVLDLLAKGGRFWEVSEGVYARPEGGALLWCWKPYSKKNIGN